jgi:hypothetical protein
VALVGVAAAGDDDQREFALSSLLDDEQVARHDVCWGDRELAEGVAGDDVGASVVEQQLGAELVEGCRQDLHQGPQVLRALGLRGQWQVPAQAAPRALVAGEDVPIVAVEDRDPGLVREGLGGAVALVGVEVHDHRALDAACFQCPAQRDAQVVVDAEALAAERLGVVVATRQLKGELAAQRSLRGEQRAAGGEAHGSQDALVEQLDGSLRCARDLQDVREDQG